jgi:hypothetical protein
MPELIAVTISALLLLVAHPSLTQAQKDAANKTAAVVDAALAAYYSNASHSSPDVVEGLKRAREAMLAIPRSARVTSDVSSDYWAVDEALLNVRLRQHDKTAMLFILRDMLSNAYDRDGGPEGTYTVAVQQLASGKAQSAFRNLYGLISHK